MNRVPGRTCIIYYAIDVITIVMAQIASWIYTMQNTMVVWDGLEMREIER